MCVTKNLSTRILDIFFVSMEDFSVKKYPSTLADVAVRLGDLKCGTITADHNGNSEHIRNNGFIKSGQCKAFNLSPMTSDFFNPLILMSEIQFWIIGKQSSFMISESTSSKNSPLFIPLYEILLNSSNEILISPSEMYLVKCVRACYEGVGCLFTSSPSVSEDAIIIIISNVFLKSSMLFDFIRSPTVRT